MLAHRFQRPDFIAPISDISSDVINGYEQLRLDVRLAPLQDYFEDTFIGKELRHKLMQPFFPVRMWNMHERIAAGMPKTNNAVESWHRAFNRNVTADHPSLFHLMAVIRKKQNHTKTLLAQVNVNRQVADQRWAQYAQLTARFQTLHHSR
jgi:hypothetical protein